MVGETETKEEHSVRKDEAKGRIEGCVVLTWGCKKSWPSSHTQMYHTQLIAKGKCSKEITTDNNKKQRTPHPYFEEVQSRLVRQNCGRTTCLQGKTVLL